MTEIVPYEEKYKPIFENLNKAWIEKYFNIEELDRKALEHPKTYILDKGGYILIALYDGKPVGACALIKMDDERYDYELAKMAVDKQYRGKGIGKVLCQAVIDKAKEVGAKSVFLESNTVLETAIILYRKLGFKETGETDSPYNRCNIQMELTID